MPDWSGIGVYGTTGRTETGYSPVGADLTAEYWSIDAGLASPSVETAASIDTAAFLRARAAGQ